MRGVNGPAALWAWYHSGGCNPGALSAKGGWEPAHNEMTAPRRCSGRWVCWTAVSEKNSLLKLHCGG